MSAIVRICQGQPELAIRIVQPGCTGGQLLNYKDTRLVITAPECPAYLKSPLHFKGCWPGFSGELPYTFPEVPHELPVLVYPAFRINDNGDTVFRFDSLFFDYPPGRYIGTVEFTNGCIINQFEIDYCMTPFLIDRISQTAQAC